ncbi:MAG: hypothetical protein AB7K24_21305 [Gemmataceae bacterium]
MSSKKRSARRASVPDLKGKSFAFFGVFGYWPSYHGGTPDQVARRYGAKVRTVVDDALDYLVLGDRRGTGRADAKKKAEKLRARATSKKAARPEIIDEAAFRDLVKIDLTGKSFAFFGGFDCSPDGFEDGLLAGMVQGVGGVLHSEVDEQLDYLVLGSHRGAGKIAARNRAEKLRQAGHAIAILDESSFLELARIEQPGQQTGAASAFASFMSRLYGVVDERKLGRALKMLKAESFKLYSHLDDERLVGVVRSQSEADTVYAPWLTPAGRYGCATVELDNCPGLQGGTCKQLLVLLVGLARVGEMSLERAYSWIHATVGKGPKRDQDLAADTFLQYRAAEAGELDWRPTETIPEDFYAY